MKQSETKSIGKTFTGKVVSIAMNKTVTVEIEHTTAHPIYKKAMRRSKKFAVHNEIAGIKVGDTVKIMETRPISKRKHFKVVNKVEIK